MGKFEVPNWDPVSQKKIRDALSVLGSMLGHMPDAMFGSKSEVNPIHHLIGTAIGWGGNPTLAHRVIRLGRKIWSLLEA